MGVCLGMSQINASQAAKGKFVNLSQRSAAFPKSRGLTHSGKPRSAAELFGELRKNFAQSSQTEEEAYLEIAKKLMKLQNEMPGFESCMDQCLTSAFESQQATYSYTSTTEDLNDTESLNTTAT